MSRSIWKNKYIIYQKGLLNKIENYDKIKLYNKNTIVFEKLIGKTIEIYNGIKFVPILIKSEMINYKIGSFIRTKKLSIFKKEKKKKKK